MKKTLYIVSLFGILTGAACHPTYVVQNDPAPAPAAPQEEVSYQNFYDDLAPYGQWIDYPGYGYVWMPNAGPDFKPYSTNGHWIYTDMGWAWNSDYNWGWAPFHYGRWFYEGGYGWMWVPGQEWSPAWVSWRTSSDYYGWAPLGPNVSMSVGSYNPPSNYWCFVPHQYVSNQHINSYYVNESRNITIINNTTVINNRGNGNNNVRGSYAGGPDPREVERFTGSSIRPVVVRENNRPGEQLNNGQYSIYRPRVNAAPSQSAGTRPQRVAPARVESLKDIKPRTSANNTSGVQTNNSQPANRNNNAMPTSPTNSTRTVEAPPALNTRQQELPNNNQAVKDRPAERNNTVPAPAPANNLNNQPIQARTNERNNAVNQNEAVRPQPANSSINRRPANNVSATNRPASRATTNNGSRSANNLNRAGKNGGQTNQLKRVNGANSATTARPVNTKPADKKKDDKPGN